jgi:tetratricopeptide (TPR) repeat protein
MALKCLQEALVIRRSVLGDDHLDVSATLTYLGTIFYRRSGTSMALQLFNESLRIRIDHHGTLHRDVSFTLYNISLCQMLLGSYKEAIRCYEETLRIEEAVLGPKHKDVSMTTFKLGEAYAADGEFEKALSSFRTSLEIERSFQEDADPATIARILNEIASLYLAEGDTQRMMETYIEAARVLQGAGLPPFDSLSLPDQLYGFGITCPSSAPSA